MRLSHENLGPYRHAFGINADETNRVAQSEYFTDKRIAFGFNSDEQKRIDRANIYSSQTRTSFYPLVEWGWNREICSNYLKEMFGVASRRSACVQCPTVLSKLLRPYFGVAFFSSHVNRSFARFNNSSRGPHTRHG